MTHTSPPLLPHDITLQQNMRLLEALLFSKADPVGEEDIAPYFSPSVNISDLLERLRSEYQSRGVHLVRFGKKWAFRTAVDLADDLNLHMQKEKKLSRPALETLAIIAYHQPITRAEIEEIRGVSLSKGTMDTLLELGWIRPKGRKRTPGRPMTWATSEKFLDHFQLSSLDDLPGVGELKAMGLLDTRPAITLLGARKDSLLSPDASEYDASENDASENDASENDDEEDMQRTNDRGEAEAG